MARRGFVRALLALLFICVPVVGNSSADDLAKGLGRDLRESGATVARAAAKLRAGETPASEIVSLKSIYALKKYCYSLGYMIMNPLTNENLFSELAKPE